MGAKAPEWVVTRNDGAHAALILIHGFSGRPEATFGKLPDFLCQDDRLTDWDIHALGYPTRLSPDFRGIWSGDPDLSTLATLLHTRLTTSDFSSYKALVLVAHSMGGLVAQRALLDDKGFQQRVSHLFLFGTPSNGLSKASLVRWLKPQLRDMVATGRFIRTLRQDWTSEVEPIGRPKVFAIAGDRDEFVPVPSSLGPFPLDQQHVVHGDHSQIVKPDSADDLSVKLLVDGLTKNSAPKGPLSAARVAIESLEFQDAVDRLWPHREELDEQHLVQLALALEQLDRSEEALEILERADKRGTDAQGVLAGRIKRSWHVTGKKSDQERAMELYHDAYKRSEEAGDHAQAFYHGINVAYLLLAARQNPGEAEKWAERVLKHCAAAPQDMWRLATEAEANLHLGDGKAALEYFRRALELNPSPREARSMSGQAFRVAALKKQAQTLKELEALFQGVMF